MVDSSSVARVSEDEARKLDCVVITKKLECAVEEDVDGASLVLDGAAEEDVDEASSELDCGAEEDVDGA